MKTNDVKRLLSLTKKSALVTIAERALISGGKATGTNMETSLTVETDIQGEGVVDLNAFKNAGKYDSAWIECETLYIKKGGGIMKSKAYPAEEYPSYKGLPQETDGLIIHKDVTALKRLLDFAGKDDLRPAMTGVYCDGSHFAATDAHRLSWQKNIGEKVPEMIIPQSAIRMLNETLHYNIFVNTDDDNLNHVWFVNNLETVSFRPIEGNYPNYRAVVPYANDTVAQVNAEALKQAVNRALPSANRNTKSGTFVFTPESLTISSEDIDENTQYSETIPAKMAGSQEFTIGFNLLLLQRLISSLEEIKYHPEITIEMSEPIRCAIVNRYNLLMPVLIDCPGRVKLEEGTEGVPVYEKYARVKVYDPYFDEYYAGRISGVTPYPMGRVLYNISPADGAYGTEAWEDNIKPEAEPTETPIKAVSKIGKNIEAPSPKFQAPSPKTEEPSPKPEEQPDTASQQNSITAAQLFVIENLTEKSFAIIGCLDMLPEEFRTKYGSQANLNIEKQRVPGLMFSKKRRAMLSEIIESANIQFASI